MTLRGRAGTDGERGTTTGTGDSTPPPMAADPPSPALTRDSKDFKFIRALGDGSFSTVYLGREVGTEREVAIKVIDKAHIRREKKLEYVKREKDVLIALVRKPHPFFVSLYCTFQDHERLYFVLSLARKGELLDYMRKLGSFDDDVTRFYTAEILVALDHLHSIGIIHRDLKPENILLSEKMHIVISDFGSAKIIGSDDVDTALRPTPLVPPPVKKRSSFVGTAQYVSPEVLNGKPVTPKSDLWALACIVFQMLAGLPPFRAANEYLVFQKINKLDYSFPSGFPESPAALIQALLRLDEAERLSVAQCREADFFTGLAWGELWAQEPPDLHPYLPASGDQPAFHSSYKGTDEDVEPGWDESRLLGLSLADADFATLDKEEEAEAAKAAALSRQSAEHPFHSFVQGHLILKSGLVDKRKGLFARRRMLLLTEGPHLFYVDAGAMVLKGEIPWSKELRPEAKNFKTYFVHTPSRTYYLEDPSGHALDWCDAIEAVRIRYFAHRTPSQPDVSSPHSAAPL